MPNSLSELHTLHAWEDNQITERCTQGEYAGKVLQFKLVDKDGDINLSNCLVQYAVTRPDKTEDLLDCTVDNGVVKCNLTYSATSISGLVHGEVRVIGSNNSGTIKFYGVNLCVYKGVSDEAAEQSDEFTALVAALQKVVSITPDPDSENTYVVRLDDSIVQNGLNPVASGVIYDYLTDDYKDYLQQRFSSFKYAHETHSSSYDAELNPVDVYNDSTFDGVYIDEATELGTCYIIKNLNGANVGLLFCASVPTNINSAKTQIALYYNGNFKYRYKHSNGGEWDEWTSIELQKNRDVYNSGDTTYFGVSDSDSKYPSSKSIYRFISANSQTIANIYKTVFDSVICNYKYAVVDSDSTFSIYNDKIETYLSNSNYDTTDYTYTYVPNSVGDDKDFPNCKTISLPSGSYSITITDTEDMKSKTENTSGNTYTIWNLVPNRNYTYIIRKSNGDVLDYGLVKATGQVRMINGSCGETDSYGGRPFNIRDLGGWSCDGGKIKYGKIFRGGELKGGIFENSTWVQKINVTNSQIKFFKDELGIRDEIDLRSDEEASAAGLQTPLGVGVDYLHIVFPFAHRAVLENDNDSIAARATVIKRIAKDIKEGKPVYIHCRQGADRTGIVCTLIEAICGVSQSDIDKDYELTSFARDYGIDGGSRIVRMRNQTESVLGRHKDFVTAISSMEGSSFNDKIVRLLLRSGVTIDEINDIRFGLIDGSPSKLTNPYGNATITKSLTGVAIDNAALSTALYQPYEATLTVNNLYKLESVTLTMGGNNAISYYSNGKIYIPVVTGNIVIGASATQSEIITENMIDDGAVTTNKIFDGAVTDIKLANKKWNFVDLGQVNSTSVFDDYVNTETIYVVKVVAIDCLFFITGNTQVRYIHTVGWEKRRKVNDTWEEWQGAIFTNSIQNSAITTDKIANLNVTEGKLSSELQAKINRTTGVYSYTIPASNWSNNAQSLNLSSVYTVTSKTKVDIEGDDTVLEQLVTDDCEGIYVENNNGSLTIKAITNAPTENITVQLVIYEVEDLN